MSSEHADPVRRKQTDEMVLSAQQLGHDESLLYALVDDLSTAEWLLVGQTVRLLEEAREAEVARSHDPGPVPETAD